MSTAIIAASNSTETGDYNCPGANDEATFTTALAALASGDTLYMREGDYRLNILNNDSQSLLIPAGVKLLGESARAWLWAMSKGTRAFPYLLKATAVDSVTLERFTIKGEFPSGLVAGMGGIQLHLCNDANVKNVIVEDTDSHHLALHGSTYVTVDGLYTYQRNGFSSAHHGVDLDRDETSGPTKSDHITIKNGTLRNGLKSGATSPSQSTKVENAINITYDNMIFESDVTCEGNDADALALDEIVYQNSRFNAPLLIGTRTVDGNIHVNDNVFTYAGGCIVVGTDDGYINYAGNSFGGINSIIKEQTASPFAAVAITKLVDGGNKYAYGSNAYVTRFVGADNGRPEYNTGPHRTPNSCNPSNSALIAKAYSVSGNHVAFLDEQHTAAIDAVGAAAKTITLDYLKRPVERVSWR